MSKETNKKYKMKKDEYIGHLERTNARLTLVNQLLLSKLKTISSIAGEPIKIIDWFNDDEKNLVFKEIGDKVNNDEFKGVEKKKKEINN